MLHHYSITLHLFFSSPQNNYFTNPKCVVGDAPTLSHKELSLVPGRGIKDDRFEEGQYPITFFSLEVADVIEKVFEREIDIALYRRNIIISGVNLCELIGRQFRVGDVLFEGMAHCNPCTWMNAIIGKGTYREMKGRGGLRAKVIEGGTLRLGETRLESDIILTKAPEEAMILSRLPKGL